MTDLPLNNSSKTQFISSEQVWQTINNIKSSGPKKVAAAYIGSKAKLEWKSGDILVVALSDENVRSGLVDPFLLERLKNQVGVKIYKCEKLHAKVFRFEDCAVVGSMNLSGRSQSYFLEACIYSRDEEVTSSKDEFFNELVKDKNLVDDQELKQFQEKFKLDISLSCSGLNVDSKKIWLINTCTVDIPPNQQSNSNYLENIDRNIYQQRKLYFGINQAPYKEIVRGDIVIEINKSPEGIIYLYPPLICIGAELKTDWRILFFRYLNRNRIPLDQVKNDLDFDMINYGGSKELFDQNEIIVKKINKLFGI